jgi:hypothetical protein
MLRGCQVTKRAFFDNNEWYSLDINFAFCTLMVLQYYQQKYVVLGGDLGYSTT